MRTYPIVLSHSWQAIYVPDLFPLIELNTISRGNDLHYLEPNQLRRPASPKSSPKHMLTKKSGGCRPEGFAILAQPSKSSA